MSSLSDGTMAMQEMKGPREQAEEGANDDDGDKSDEAGEGETLSDAHPEERGGWDPECGPGAV
jgi:hypothetical protein